ncbi:hypothetical protein OIU84_009131 [Salix udensis]|uniref:DUF382 domain-containing protein n=1 Tax=Salix udensis TaxID=889485 RepID=A0AAD6NY29_9ROSI|nr:hypothetical protein OIU84_009131 [Salix udensis]
MPAFGLGEKWDVNDFFVMLPCGDFVVDRSGFRLQNPSKKKEVCSRPDVVEVWDATSADPKLLVFLKSYKNTVPVPRHWCQKRKFLQGSGCDNHGALTCRRRFLLAMVCQESQYDLALMRYLTFSKPPNHGLQNGVSVVLRSNLFTFQLPDFIAATGIEKIRQIPFMIVIFCQDSECAFIDPVGR